MTHRPRADAQGIRRPRPIRGLAIGGILFAAGVLVGQQWAQRGGAATPARAATATAAPAPRAPLPRPPAFLPSAPVPLHRLELPAKAPAERASHTINALFRRLSRVPPVPGTENAEGRANFVKDFLLGMVEALALEGPEMQRALAEEYTARLCEGRDGLAEEQVLALATLGQAFPQITTAKAFDCFFSRNEGQENLPVWAMLDAWRHSGHEKNRALRELEASARDQRTKFRFLSPEEEIRMRAGSDQLPTR
jgi:hypothetical protein